MYTRQFVGNITIILREQTIKLIMNQPFSEQVSPDVIEFIMSGLNMFDLVKLGHVNKYYYELSEKNNLWEIFYEKMFNRSFIDKDSVHEGDVTWWRCKVGHYPGWSRVHLPIDNSCQKCRIRSHYSNLSEKKSKIKYKNYKKMVMKRYKTIVLNDTFVKTNDNDLNSLKYHKRLRDRAQRAIDDIESRINLEKEIKNDFQSAEECYKTLETKPKSKKKTNQHTQPV
tara:strand:- start:7 stop:684 length:678 start_codon:yes stop_codon:yes gene_type:complete